MSRESLRMRRRSACAGIAMVAAALVVLPAGADAAGGTDGADGWRPIEAPAGDRGVDRSSGPPGQARPVELDGLGDERSPTVVRLPTGDRVRLASPPGSERSGGVGANATADGRHRGEAPGVEVLPGPGRDDIDFSITRIGDDVTVVPADAAALLAAGRLDPRLFDVTALARQGFGVATGDERLPLLIERPALGRPGMVDLSDLSGLSGLSGRPDGRVASVLGFAPVEVPASDLGELWTALRSADDTKVWLDGRVTAQPASDLAAPAASPAASPATSPAANPATESEQPPAAAGVSGGPSGRGVRVAVLDTGVDAAHPDLRDAIAAAENLSGSGSAADVGDAFGHGTHVAGVIAGSGAASDGRYRGVAPDAELLIGKVLDDEGVGSESTVLAGLEWAVREDADVVNLSLGADEPSDGTDPVSRAVDRLSSRALFVAAAGNAGPEHGTVAAPGAASSALTVAAHDRDGRIASFSSRGPRLGDFEAKPDIAAYGVDVIAPRASGTEPGPLVDQSYTKMSGTSMAAPQVAGVAAQLAQERPEWTPAQLKAALIGSAAPMRGGEGVYAHGAGRLDATAATEIRVFAARPSMTEHLGPETAERELAYQNTGDADVTLELRSTGGQGVMSFRGADRRSVTVPAGGTANVPVTFHPEYGQPDRLHQAMVTATGAARPIRTPITAYGEPADAAAPESSAPTGPIDRLLGGIGQLTAPSPIAPGAPGVAIASGATR